MGQIFFLVLLTSILSFCQCNSMCNVTTQKQCLSMNHCQWIQDNSKSLAGSVCINQTFCNSLDEGKCKQNPLCSASIPKEGNCYQKTLNCNSQMSEVDCLNKGRYCFWKKEAFCREENPDLTPQCSSLTDKDCQANNLFCELQQNCKQNLFNCPDTQKREDCESEGCEYLIDIQASCVYDEKADLCSNLGEFDCMSNTYCEYVQSFQKKCEETIQCQNLSRQDCSSQSEVCTLQEIPRQCKSKNFFCHEIHQKELCIDFCVWNESGSCVTSGKCENLQTDFECLSQQLEGTQLCDFIPQQFVCSNSGYCSKQKNCKFAQEQGKCKSSQELKGECKPLKDKCLQLDTETCKSTPTCKILEEQGKCSTKNLCCDERTIEECQNYDHCHLETASCTNKSNVSCETISNDKCWQYPHCLIFQGGECIDRLFFCNDIEERNKCLLNNVCEWKNSLPFSCKTETDCSLLDLQECTKNSPMCQVVPNPQIKYKCSPKK